MINAAETENSTRIMGEGGSLIIIGGIIIVLGAIKIKKSKTSVS
jgi:hypothetical protein